MSAGACSPRKNFKILILPLRCHFLHFEIRFNGNTALKDIPGSWLDAKRVKMAEKPQKKGEEACQKDWL